MIVTNKQAALGKQLVNIQFNTTIGCNSWSDSYEFIIKNILFWGRTFRS